MIASLVLLAAIVGGPTTAIRVDQVGYRVVGTKSAMIVAPTPASLFIVNRIADGEEVFRGTVSAPVLDPDSGDRVQLADFSQLTQPGRYELRVAGVGRSWPFDVAADPYVKLLRLATRSYYGQRCGMAVDLGAEFPGYAHPACHVEEAFHRTSGRTGGRSATGGWHDAGDYGRYIVNSGISSGTLLWAWELFPEAFAQMNLDIPESKNATPDLLDEVRWNLDWMLSMQDADGGVWQKQTSKDFAPFVNPQADDSVSYVIGTGSAPFKSSCATADFSAVMAIASRVYRPYDEAFADRALVAAKRAWGWLTVNPNVTFRNPRGILTGEYGDRQCSDERLWAAAELWRSARVPQANAYFLEHSAEAIAAVKDASPPSWQNVGALAAWTYALDGKGDAAVVSAIRSRSRAAADHIVARSAAHPYRIPMTSGDYIWGSNAVAANYALQLLIANELASDPRYVAASADVLHYLLGRNTFSLSFVTRVGTNAVRHPHHRPSANTPDGEPWPGLLAGGPNRLREDPALRRVPAAVPPARAYVDERESYSGNEVAINWNAPLVFVTAGCRHATSH